MRLKPNRSEAEKDIRFIADQVGMKEPDYDGVEAAAKRLLEVPAWIERLDQRVRHRDSELVRISEQFRLVRDEIVDIASEVESYVDAAAIRAALHEALNRR